MAGGDPMLVLRRSADVVRSLVGGTHFAMAGLTGTIFPVALPRVVLADTHWAAGWSPGARWCCPH